MFVFSNLLKDIGWWYWLVTVILLAIGLSGDPLGFYLVIALNAVQTIHYLIRERRFLAFPVQVRATYLGMLVLAQWSPFYFLYWIQFIGTIAMVTVGYCLLARCLSLLPVNRKEPLSWNLVKRTFFSPPVSGNILQGMPAGQNT